MASRFLAPLRRLPVLLLAAGFLAVGIAAAWQAPAFAQEDPEARPWSLRDLFFPRRSERLVPPGQIGQPQKPKHKPKPVVRKPVEPPVTAVEKTTDARVILVVGDFLASGLAEGLNEFFANNPAIKVVDRAKGSSGFVRDDVYN